MLINDQQITDQRTSNWAIHIILNSEGNKTIIRCEQNMWLNYLRFSDISRVICNLYFQCFRPWGDDRDTIDYYNACARASAWISNIENVMHLWEVLLITVLLFNK